jgi:hypothetical protein
LLPILALSPDAGMNVSGHLRRKPGAGGPPSVA